MEMYWFNFPSKIYLFQALTINKDSNIVFDAAVSAQHFVTDGKTMYCIDANNS